jgi:uncharacterized protein (TIGR03435 family)
VDKTELAGSYHVTLNYDMMAARRPPSVTPPPDSAPAVFTAIQEQLGLKLEPSRTPRDTLIIDHIERPTPDETHRSHRTNRFQRTLSVGSLAMRSNQSARS